MLETVGRADHVVDGVYISGMRAIHDADALREAGITHVLRLFQDIPDLYYDPPRLPNDFVVYANGLEDGEFVPYEVLKRGTTFIKNQVDAGKKVLVMCAAGISRSSTFVLAYLLERGYSLHAAFSLLKKKHAQADPHPEMWNSLLTHYNLNFTYTEVRDWYREVES